MDISIIVPLYNEEESLPELTEWIHQVMASTGFSYEIIYVDDGSSDNSWAVIEDLAADHDAVKGIKFRRNYGKAAALNTGFMQSSGDVVITMDADLQDSPEEIPDLYKMIKEDGYDLVSGWKKKRYDPITKTLPSKFFNWTTRKMSGLKLHDMNCGLKAYKSEVVKNIEVYGEMHRYLPVIAKWAGYRKIGEKVVQHQERKYGVTKYGLDRFIKGFLDLLSITFVAKFGRRPMHLFGALGTIIFILGFLAALYLGIEKLVHLSQGIQSILIADSPYFYLSLVAMIIGTQLFLSGFLAELISRNYPDRNRYLVDKYLKLKSLRK